MRKLSMLVCIAVTLAWVSLSRASAEWSCELERDVCINACAQYGPPDPNCTGGCRADYQTCLPENEWIN